MSPPNNVVVQQAPPAHAHITEEAPADAVVVATTPSTATVTKTEKTATAKLAIVSHVEVRTREGARGPAGPAGPVGPAGSGSGGGGAPTDYVQGWTGSVPYYIPPATVWTIPINDTAVLASPSTVDGLLVCDGLLVEVS